MRVVGVVCLAVGLVLLAGLRFAGRSERAAAAWTPHTRLQAGLAGVVAVVVGVLLLAGGVQ